MVWAGFAISCVRKTSIDMNIFLKTINVVKQIAFAPIIVGMRMSRNALKD
jgi:hypothetical protein